MLDIRPMKVVTPGFFRLGSRITNSKRSFEEMISRTKDMKKHHVFWPVWRLFCLGPFKKWVFEISILCVDAFLEEGIWCFFSIRTTLIGMNILCVIPQNTHSSKRYKRVSTTVDGRNPAPAGMFSNPVNSGINYQPQLVSRISAMNSKVSVQPFTSLMEIGFFSILLKYMDFH